MTAAPASGPDHRDGHDDRTDRDRDELGRPRSARPRDGLGRPLPRGATGAPPAPPAPSAPLDPAAALWRAQSLLDAGRPFHAHEVLEDAWKAAGDHERDLWQGLAQVAVGLTHARRGNARGAIALLRRGAARIAGYRDAPPHAVDAAGVSERAGGLADRIEREGIAAVPPSELTARLR